MDIGGIGTVCHECEQIILQHVHVGDEFETAQRVPFTITDIYGGKIYLETSTGGAKMFHVEHAGMCLHWMIIDHNTIEGVGSENRNSVRRLIGANGILAQCQKCEWNPAYIWGILRALPEVHEGEGNELSIP